jgi:putative Mn2+ efflux pump MntP
MLYDALSGDEEEKADADFRLKTMFVMAVATSIDALAVGISLAFLQAKIWWSVLFIGLTTAAFSAVGLRLGNIFGARYKRSAEITGGVVLVLIGLKILVEHLIK